MQTDTGQALLSSTRRTSGANAHPSHNPLHLPVNALPLLDFREQQAKLFQSAYEDFLSGFEDFLLSHSKSSSGGNELLGEFRFIGSDDAIVPGGRQLSVKLWFDTNLPWTFPANSPDRHFCGYVDDKSIVVLNPVRHASRQAEWKPNDRMVIGLSQGRSGRLILDKGSFVAVGSQIVRIFDAAVERGIETGQYNSWQKGGRNGWRSPQKPGGDKEWRAVVAAHGYGAYT